MTKVLLIVAALVFMPPAGAVAAPVIPAPY